MIVAVVTVRMMQVAVDEVVDVVAMWNRRMSAVGRVNVVPSVAGALVVRRAVSRVRPTDRDLALVDVITVHVVQVTVVQVVNMTGVLDGRMSTVRAVDVVVIVVRVVIAQWNPSGVGTALRREKNES